MSKKGKIASWNDDKGYGFIEPLDGGPQIFVHIKAFRRGTRRPEVGEAITCVATRDSRGRLRAESAALADQKFRSMRAGTDGVPSITLALAFLAFAGSSILWSNLSPLVPVAYVVASVFTFIIYAIDKSAARRGRWRTNEVVLHFLALLGGWPGAMVAQQTLRHKSKKRSFRVVFWITVLANCAALAWLHTSDGQANFDRLRSIEITLDR